MEDEIELIKFQNRVRANYLSCPNKSRQSGRYAKTKNNNDIKMCIIYITRYDMKGNSVKHRYTSRVPGSSKSFIFFTILTIKYKIPINKKHIATDKWRVVEAAV